MTTLCRTRGWPQWSGQAAGCGSPPVCPIFRCSLCNNLMAPITSSFTSEWIYERDLSSVDFAEAVSV